MIAMAGVGIGIGFNAGKTVEGTARQPEAQGSLLKVMLVGAALTETAPTEWCIHHQNPPTRGGLRRTNLPHDDRGAPPDTALSPRPDPHRTGRLGPTSGQGGAPAESMTR